MKILVCSDIHGSKRAGDTIKYLDSINNFNKIVVLGDFLYNGPRNKVPLDYNPNYLIGLFNSFKERIIAVRGNCDADVDLMVLDFDIPKQREFMHNEHKFMLTHGDIDSIYSEEPKNNEIIMKGHTHLPILFKNEQNGICINPGSMTFPKGSLDKSFVIISDNDIILYEFDYNDDDSIIILSEHKMSENNFIK